MASSLTADIERCYEHGWTDGLPVIPPYGSLVDAMLERMGWKATELIGELKQLKLEVRAQQLAATAVMAGCRPEYGPVLRALSLALLDADFNVSGVAVTTGGPGVLVVVSGPIVAELGFWHGSNVFGAAVRPNATIGRFAQMVMRFCGTAGGALEDFGTIGHPGRITYCLAEHPETVWGPFHTQKGLSADQSAVTIFSAEAPNSVNNHYATTGRQVLETIADNIANYGSTNYYYRFGGYVVMIAPEHMSLISKEYSRDEVKRFLFEHSVRATDELIRLGRIPEQPAIWAGVERGKMRAPFMDPSQIPIVEAGGPSGKFSAVIPCWVANRTIVRAIERV